VVEQFKERRRHIRRIGQGLVVVIGQRLHPIIDISITGVAFQTGGGAPGDQMTIRLAKMTDPLHGITATITVVEVTETVTRAEFQPTIALLRFIIGHISEVTGASPIYFVPEGTRRQI